MSLRCNAQLSAKVGTLRAQPESMRGVSGRFDNSRQSRPESPDSFRAASPGARRWRFLC